MGRRSFTFATWYKSDNLGTMLLGAGSGATSQSFIWAGTGAGRPFLQHQPGNYSSAPAGLADWPYANQWIHVVLAVDMTATTPESRVRWWINGVQISQETASNDFPQNLDLYIGHTVAHTLGNKHLGDFDWTGKLADTYLIFGHALPASAFVTLSGGQVRSVVYTGPVTSESVHFRYAPGAPGENAFPNNPDWQATNITTDATDVPY